MSTKMLAAGCSYSSLKESGNESNGLNIVEKTTQMFVNEYNCKRKIILCTLYIILKQNSYRKKDKCFIQVKCFANNLSCIYISVTVILD